MIRITDGYTVNQKEPICKTRSAGAGFSESGGGGASRVDGLPGGVLGYGFQVKMTEPLPRVFRPPDRRWSGNRGWTDEWTKFRASPPQKAEPDEAGSEPGASLGAHRRFSLPHLSGVHVAAVSQTISDAGCPSGRADQPVWRTRPLANRKERTGARRFARASFFYSDFGL